MFTKNLEQVRLGIDPGERPSGTVSYPPGWSLENDGARIKHGESVHGWFNRCVEQFFDGHPERCAVEENLALLLVIKWDRLDKKAGSSALTYANCQALWVEGSLQDFCLDAGVRHQYLRMDFDPTALGPMLKEALPHVHVVPDGEPRFGLPVPSSGDVVGAFIDLVYRNYFHDDWLAWARRVWEQECEQRNRPSRFEPLVEAFKAAKVGVLEKELKGELTDLKGLLARERRKLFPVLAPADRCRLLSHE